MGRRGLAGCDSSPPYPGLGFSSWCILVSGEGTLDVRPPSSSWRAALPLLVVVVCSSLTARAGTLGGCSPWVTGCEPSFIYPGCWHRTQEGAGREATGTESVTPSQLFIFFLHSMVITKIYLVFRVYSGLLELGASSEMSSNLFSLEMRKPGTQ